MRESSAACGTSEVRLVRDSIAAFSLDLRGLTVLTEAATGHFRCTPVIALAAGASRVFAIAKDSRHGTRGEAADAVRRLAHACGVERGLVVVEDYECLADADIVTNTGFVRPISAALISRMNPTAVIPLMWETWEHRPAEVDLAACLERGVLVLGTNEGDPRLRTMDLVGTLASTLLDNAGLKIRNANVVVVGGGPFGSSVARRLDALGANVIVCAEKRLDEDVEPLRIAAALGSERAGGLLERADALVIADHHSEHVLIGPAAAITTEKLHASRGQLLIVHLSGLIDTAGLRAANCTIVPEHVPTKARTMSVTTGFLGPRPVIELHTAGLKVGQIMLSARRRGTATLAGARIEALEDPLCQDFSAAQYALARHATTQPHLT